MRALLLAAVMAVSACGDDGSTTCQALDESSACPLGACPTHFTAEPTAVCPTDGTRRFVRFYAGCRGFEAIAFMGEDVTHYAVYRSSDATLAGFATYLAPDTTTTCSPDTPFEFDASWCTSSWQIECTGPVQ